MPKLPAAMEMAQFGTNATLLSEIESLRRERDELWDLVRMQEVAEAEFDRVAASSVGESRFRSLERHWEQDRLVEAQEATANMQPTNLAFMGPLLAMPVRSPPSAAPQPLSQVERWALPGTAVPRRTPRRPATSERGVGVHASNSPASGARGSRRRAPSADAAVVGGLPRGHGRRGPGHPEGSGSGLSRGNLHGRRSNSCHRPPAASSEPPHILQGAMTEALRGLGGARGALADAAKQLSTEASKRNAEALRIHRLEQVLATSLHGFGREMRAMRAESARLRNEASRSRCRSCTRC